MGPEGGGGVGGRGGPGAGGAAGGWERVGASGGARGGREKTVAVVAHEESVTVVTLYGEVNDARRIFDGRIITDTDADIRMSRHEQVAATVHGIAVAQIPLTLVHSGTPVLEYPSVVPSPVTKTLAP